MSSPMLPVIPQRQHGHSDCSVIFKLTGLISRFLCQWFSTSGLGPHMGSPRIQTGSPEVSSYDIDVCDHATPTRMSLESAEMCAVKMVCETRTGQEPLVQTLL